MSMPPAASDALPTALRNALLAAGHQDAAAPLERLAADGLAHDHIRLVGTGSLARIPKQSQMQLDAARNLAYQAACFERASRAGHVPRLFACLPPSPGLPRGALLVEEIVGRAARLPGDLAAIMQSLAALHVLPLPPAPDCAPLLLAADPLADLRQEVARQAVYLEPARVALAVQQAVETGLHELETLCSGPGRPARRLIAFDSHPGNFVVRGERAILVDLEKCRYSYPGLDLAHATLYTSTTWDRANPAVLSSGQVVQAYAAWEAAVAPALAADARPWHLPLRRAMWLWSLTWCAKWRVLAQAPAAADTQGEDWSAARSDPALVAHVRDRVDHYLAPEVVGRVASELADLQARWAA